MNGKNYLRIIIYSILLLLCFSIQNTAGIMPRFFGTTPLLTAALAYAIAVYDGTTTAVMSAVAAGIITEVTLGSVLGPCTIVFAVASLMTNRLSHRFDVSVPFALLCGALYSLMVCAAVLLSGAVQNGIALSGGEFISLTSCRGAYTWLWCVIICLFFKKSDPYK